MLKNVISAILPLLALLASHTVHAAEQAPVEQAPVEATPAQAMPANPPDQQAVKHPAINTQPARDNHVDYRYCLELKSNREIAECRYKKK